MLSPLRLKKSDNYTENNEEKTMTQCKKHDTKNEAKSDREKILGEITELFRSVFLQNLSLSIKLGF